MPKIALTNDSNYTVGGGRILNGSPNVSGEGYKAVAKVGDRVEPHGSGEHRSAVIIQGSPSVFVNGIPVAREGDLASCGHRIVVNNDATVDIN